MKEGWRSFFNLFSEIYDELFYAYTGGHSSIVNDLVRDALSDASLVLDLCSGTCSCGSKFNCFVVALDYSLNMLKTAKKKHMKLNFVLGDAFHLPFRDKSFDAIAMTFAIHGMFPNERKRCIQEIYRVLKDNGKIAIGDHANPKDMIIHSHIKSFNYNYKEVIKDLETMRFKVRSKIIDNEEYVIITGRKL